jgi:hypothetical protein
MRTVRTFIADQRRELAEHPFFDALLRAEARPSLALPYVPHLAFWAGALEDALRLAEQRLYDPRLRQIAKQHRTSAFESEPSCPLSKLLARPEAADPRALTRAPQVGTRESTYVLLFEVLRVTEDYDRLALLLALESLSHLFFERLASFFERAGLNGPGPGPRPMPPLPPDRANIFLDLFSLDVEARHQACLVVERVYAGVRLMPDGMVPRMGPELASEHAARTL